MEPDLKPDAAAGESVSAPETAVPASEPAASSAGAVAAAAAPEPAAPATPATPPNPVKEFFESVGVSARRAYVTTVMVGICAAVYVLMVARGVGVLAPTAEEILNWGGNFAPRTTGGEWWRMLTAMFVHVGFIHLAFNGLVILQIGAFMERLLGHAGLAVLYLGAGLGGGVATIFAHPNIVSAGASGAGWGLYGGLLGVLVAHRQLIPAPVVKSLGKAAVVFIGYNVAFSLRPNVDFAAHLGGLAAGFALGMALPLGFRTQAPGKRAGRLALTAVLAVAVMGAIAAAAPRHGALIEEFAKVEGTVIDQFNAALKKFQAGEITAAQLGQVVERDVIPPWHAERVRLAGARSLNEPLRKVIALMEAREAAWEQLVKAAASDTEEDWRAFADKSDQAAKVAEGLVPKK